MAKSGGGEKLAASAKLRDICKPASGMSAIVMAAAGMNRLAAAYGWRK
jgi:hypothetical protein